MLWHREERDRYWYRYRYINRQIKWNTSVLSFSWKEKYKTEHNNRLENQNQHTLDTERERKKEREREISKNENCIRSCKAKESWINMHKKTNVVCLLVSYYVQVQKITRLPLTVGFLMMFNVSAGYKHREIAREKRKTYIYIHI